MSVLASRCGPAWGWFRVAPGPVRVRPFRVVRRSRLVWWVMCVGWPWRRGLCVLVAVLCVLCGVVSWSVVASSMWAQPAGCAVASALGKSCGPVRCWVRVALAPVLRGCGRVALGTVAGVRQAWHVLHHVCVAGVMSNPMPRMVSRTVSVACRIAVVAVRLLPPGGGAASCSGGAASCVGGCGCGWGGAVVFLSSPPPSLRSMSTLASAPSSLSARFRR